VSVYDVDYDRQRFLPNREQDGLRRPVLSVVPSHDARIVATWLDEPVNISDLQLKRPNAVIRLVEVATGKVIQILKGHQSSVAEAAWSPDGRLLATGDRRGNFHEPTSDQAVRLWDVVTGKELAVFTDVRANVTALAFAPDGKTLGAGLRDGSILVWDVSKAEAALGLAQTLSGQELEGCWTALGGEDAGKAYQAIWKLTAAPKDLHWQTSPPFAGALGVCTCRCIWS
jgi:WD40 repeat protein